MNKKLCSLLLTLSAQASALTLFGQEVIYQVVDPAQLGGYVGSAQFNWRGQCVVKISRDAQYATYVAHELAHCLDQGRSSGFGNAGCRLRRYACAPAEGYADTYALLYLERFGQDLAPLGWNGSVAASDLPHPDEATPQALERLFH